MRSIERLAAIDASTPHLADGLPTLPLKSVLLMRMIRATSQGVSSYLDLLVRPLGLNENLLHALILLFATERGASTPGILCDLLGQTRANMTRILETLESRGLLSRRSDAHDHRRQLVRITAKGKQLIRKSVPKLAGPFAALTDSLSQRELSQLETLLRKLMASIDRSERQIHAARG